MFRAPFVHNGDDAVPPGHSINLERHDAGAILKVLLTHLPFVTSALARAAFEAGGEPPENARPALKRLLDLGFCERRQLRLLVKPTPLFGTEPAKHIQCLDGPVPKAPLKKVSDKKLRKRVPEAARIEPATVWIASEEVHSKGNAFDRQLALALLNEEQVTVFASSKLPARPTQDDVKSNVMDKQTTCIQNLGYLLLSKLLDRKERDYVAATWQFQFDDPNIALTTYCDHKGRKRGLAYVGSVGGNDLANLFVRFRDLQCWDVTLW